MVTLPRRRRLVRAVTASLLLASACGAPAPRPPAYPPTQAGDVADDYFGTRVPDPYRWMEALDAPEVTSWIAAQNTLTAAELDAIALREPLRQRITALWNYPKAGLPVREGGRYFYTKNSGLERQAVLYYRADLSSPPDVALDPNMISQDGTISLSQWAPSPDGRLIAYGLSEGGADWRTVHVRKVDKQEEMHEEIKWVRFSDISWTRDSQGFFYSRYPEPPAGKALEAALSGQALYYHRLGTRQSQDRLIYQRKDLPSWFVAGTVTEDGRYLVVSLAKGSDNNNRVYVADLGNPLHPNIGAPVRPIIEADDAEFSVFGNAGARLYIRTDRGAPNRKVIAVDLHRPAAAGWTTVVPERTDQSLENVAFVGGRVVAQYLDHVKSRIVVFSNDGRTQADVPLPGVGAVSGISGRGDAPTVFFHYSSPLTQGTVYAYDPATKTRTSFEAAKPAFDASGYETTQRFAVSKDGTKVPYFLTARKGLAKDGSHPVMVYGYGGFSISTLPTYRPDVPAWLELGGIWVTANMRGGAEYGEAWHKAGRLDQKQRVFDDFVAVAEDLIKEKYTSPARLAMMGGSNGGLLVGAVMQQRPDLFAVALPAVGVMDMLRYDRFTGGRAWVTEYGSSSDREQFAFLFKYSPVHNAKAGTCYPATLVTTADHDDRVVPSHSFKFTAVMQKAQGCAKPILIRVETMGSHGFRPTDKLIAERADQWAFAARNMGIK